MNIDEWIGITTPKGEKINVNINTEDDADDNEIRIAFYDTKTFEDNTKQVGEHFDTITINKADIRNELIKRYKDEHDEEVDNKLYPIINSILFPNNEYTMNEFPKLFGKYCDIRNNLCEQIEELKELTRRYK